MSTEQRVHFETRSVKTVRGLEGRTRSKFEQEGWEFVSQEQGKMRSELTFRRPKPQAPWKLIGTGGVLFAVVIVAVLLGNAFGGDNNSKVEAVSPSAQTPSQSASADSMVPSVAPSPTSVTLPPAAAPLSAPVVADTTVDELLDRLNAAHMGGIKVGDRFRLTGELFTSDLWMTGAAGEYTVMLKAQGGAQDLSVFVDKSITAGWRNGSKIQMIVEMGEATINGETTDGWLRVLSAETLP